MSSLKGFDRIALVIAVIAIVPGIYIGYLWDQDFRKVETPEYKMWEDKKEAIAEREKLLTGGWGEFHDDVTMYPPERWKYSSTWFSIIVGLVGFGPISFVVVFCSIRVTNRLAVFSIRGTRLNDKLALALSIIAIMPAFYVGYSLHHQTGRFARWPWSYDNWISVIWGYLFVLISFPVLVYGIRGTSRLISWVAEGFKGDRQKGG